MQCQYRERKFTLAISAFFVMLVIIFLTETPLALVILAGGLVITGFVGWIFSKNLPLPWVIRLVSTLMIALGGGFLGWYFTAGHARLGPILELDHIFQSWFASNRSPGP